MIGLMSLLFAMSFEKVNYSSMSCPEAQTLIKNVYRYNEQSEYITKEETDEIVEVIKESTPECF